jgi:hypothetical protein
LGLVVAGICLAIAVGVSDFCVAPNENILSVVGGGGGTSAEVATFYINCPPGATNPLTGDIMNASAKINQSITDLNELPENVTQDLRVSLTTTRTASDAVSAASGCDELNAAYVDAVQALCDPSLTGLFCILVVAAIAAIMLTVSAVVVLRRGPPQDAYDRLDNTPLFKR